MIRFKDWTITAEGLLLAQQFDNLTRRLEVRGELPAGWEWAMLVQVDNAMDIILKETGKVFAGVLEDAGVYKNTPSGKNAFRRFADYVNQV